MIVQTFDFQSAMFDPQVKAMVSIHFCGHAFGYEHFVVHGDVNLGLDHLLGAPMVHPVVGSMTSQVVACVRSNLIRSCSCS